MKIISMRIPDKTLKELKNIFSEEYKMFLSDDELLKFGISLLRITKIGINVLARTEEENSSVEARVETLESKTSK